MAKVFISYSSTDKEVVISFAKTLREYGHEIIMGDTLLEPGDDWREELTSQMRAVDTIIFFVTKNSVQSKNVNNEIKVFRNIRESKKQLIIPLVKDDELVPEELQRYHYIALNQTKPNEAAEKVHHSIVSVFNKNNEQQNEYQSSLQEEITKYTPSSFAKGLHDALINLAKGDLKEWTYQGVTDIVYGTPGGSWEDFAGFLFENEEYSFIIRSIWNVGSSGTNSYLVIESNNLGGQLANVALDNASKFVNSDGVVSIFETYDMTVGYGRRSREEVKAAFKAVGKSDNVITSFKNNFFLWSVVVLDILKWAVYRENAKKEILKSNIDSGETNVVEEPKYWLLKIWADNWRVDQMNVGELCHYNSHTSERTPRVDYTLFKSVKTGDRGLAYDYSGKNAIVFLFDVVEALHNDTGREEVFTFKVTHILDQPISITEFENLINFVDQIGRKSSNKLFPISKDTYSVIKSLSSAADNSNKRKMLAMKASLTSYSTDRAVKDIEDSLGFMDDVNALSSIMAYKEVLPPLAVGLFGHWGTGKSFFISKLQQKVDQLSKDHRGVFCENVLQINFNSWHYSDSNLWASLITKIFDELKKYGDQKSGRGFEKLLQELNSTQELIEETEHQKILIDNELKELREKKRIQDENIEANKKALEALKRKDIFSEIIKSPGVTDELAKIDAEFPLWKVVKERNNIDKQIQEFENVGKDVTEAIRLANSNTKTKWGFRITILVFLVAILVIILPFFSDVVNGIIVNVTALFAGLGSLLVSVLKYIQPYYTQLKDAIKKLKDIRSTIANLEAKAEQQIRSTVEDLSTKIEAALDNSREYKKKIDLLMAEEDRLIKDIQDISSGRKIIHFIENRVSDERYVNSLGIVSWIRKDFEQLNELLYEKKEIRAEGRDSAQIDEIFKLDRIILYIDDLDRCNEKVVVQVLEAIHLLLAFPLFVVVVGVDPRWMHIALNKKYQHLEFDVKYVDKEDLETRKVSSATTYDYMEKIFQIPFTLKPMNDRGKQELIQAQFETNRPAQVLTATPSVGKLETITEDYTSEAVYYDVIPENNNTNSSADENDTSFPDETERHVKVDLDKLSISEDEIEFMKAISIIIGDSPRTVKRYVNIYRIIRTHREFKFQSGQEHEYYCGAMVLLSVMTGLPDFSYNFYKAVSNADNKEYLKDFIKREYLSVNNPDLTLKAALDNIYNSTDNSLRILSSMTMDKLKENQHLVSRFSFRNL